MPRRTTGRFASPQSFCRADRPDIAMTQPAQHSKTEPQARLFSTPVRSDRFILGRCLVPPVAWSPEPSKHAPFGLRRRIASPAHIDQLQL